VPSARPQALTSKVVVSATGATCGAVPLVPPPSELASKAL
jgi:hypothetical protein